jgi:hypothetical protein
MEAGSEFTITYPFVRGAYGADIGETDKPTWQPGIRDEWISAEDTGTVADGLGFAKFTVQGVFKPGRYPTRVFFTRAFTDPDGKTFGAPKLHIATLQKFNRLIAGYRVPFGLGEPMPHHWSASQAKADFEAMIAREVAVMNQSNA